MALMLAEEVFAYIHFLFLLRCFCRSNLRAKQTLTSAFISLLRGLGAPNFSVFENFCTAAAGGDD
jgi:hypothetical protein